MSKKVRYGLAIGLILVTAAGLFWYFRSQNQKTTAVQREISIQEASIGTGNYLTHNNFAGFNFEYPDNLTLKETELDNAGVYAAIELTSSGGQTMTLRIYDDRFTDIEAWLNDFEVNNVVVDMTNVLWADLEAKQFETGTPRQLYTVAVDNNVTYLLTSPIDTNFFREAHEHLISSFKFTAETGNTSPTAPAESNDENITLIEETIL